MESIGQEIPDHRACWEPREAAAAAAVDPGGATTELSALTAMEPEEVVVPAEGFHLPNRERVAVRGAALLESLFSAPAMWI